jgi:hypothetical protein
MSLNRRRIKTCSSIQLHCSKEKKSSNSNIQALNVRSIKPAKRTAPMNFLQLNYNTLGNACDPLGAPHYKHKKHRIRRPQAKGWTEGSWFHSRQGLNFFFSIASTPALWPTQWLPEKLSVEVQWSDREDDRSTQRRD